MSNPVLTAKKVLETKGIGDVPAEFLHNIADQENIRYTYVCLPNDPKLGGQLLYKGKKKGIIINTLINHQGRHNFTFAHELGHYFLQHESSYTLDGKYGFWCTVDDIGESLLPKEIEANSFAVELLMPEERFRLDMIGAPLDFALIGSLSNKYMVSKHACSNRILEFIREPHIIITSSGYNINTIKASKAAMPFLKSNLLSIPVHTAAHKAITAQRGQRSFVECDAIKWLNTALVGTKLYSCTHGKAGHCMTILRW